MKTHFTAILSAKDYILIQKALKTQAAWYKDQYRIPFAELEEIKKLRNRLVYDAGDIASNTDTI